MRKLVLFLIALTISVAASAQYMVAPPDVKVAKDLKVMVNGEKVSSNYVMKYLTQSYGEDVAKAWQKNVKASNAGHKLAKRGALIGIVGAVGAGVGYYAGTEGGAAMVDDLVPGLSDQSNLIFTVGGACAAVGATMFLIGKPMKVICKKKATRIINEHSNCFIDDYQFTLGLQNNGLGLAFNF